MGRIEAGSGVSKDANYAGEVQLLSLNNFYRWLGWHIMDVTEGQGIYTCMSQKAQPCHRRPPHVTEGHHRVTEGHHGFL